MKIGIEWHGQQFNVLLSNGDKEPFLTVKGCRIVNGSKGDFVSWPATKNQSTGKYWNHCYASDGFAAAVLAEAQKTQPREPVRGKQSRDDSDVPF